jgi:hypothetical protein
MTLRHALLKAAASIDRLAADDLLAADRDLVESGASAEVREAAWIKRAEAWAAARATGVAGVRSVWLTGFRPQ